MSCLTENTRWRTFTYFHVGEGVRVLQARLHNMHGMWHLELSEGSIIHQALALPDCQVLRASTCTARLPGTESKHMPCAVSGEKGTEGDGTYTEDGAAGVGAGRSRARPWMPRGYAVRRRTSGDSVRSSSPVLNSPACWKEKEKKKGGTKGFFFFFFFSPDTGAVIARPAVTASPVTNA